MPIAIFLAAVTIGLSFTIGFVATGYGPRVADRFLERSTDYRADELRDWVRAHPAAARGYAFPVLFPLDLFFMVFLGGFLAYGSVASGEALDFEIRFIWLCPVLPVLYIAADLIEDVLLARLLLSPDSITDRSVGMTKAATRAKFATSILAIAQTIVLSGLAAVAEP
jgi:hypothetical protein